MHSPLGGSNADIWGNCDAFVVMNQNRPPMPPSSESETGTTTHEIGAELIKAATVGRSPGWKDFDGKQATNGVLFTEEMFEAAEVYAADVISEMRSAGVFAEPNLLVEKFLAVPRIHPAAFGTLDAALYHKGRLILWDAKFGHGYIDPYMNHQGAFYLAGLYDLLNIDGQADQFLEVEIRIAQPNVYRPGGPIHSWKTTGHELRGLINKLEARAAAQFQPDPVATSGPHCRYCPARFECPASLRAGPSLYEAAVVGVPNEMPPAALGLQARIVERAIEHLSAVKTGLDEQILATIRGGTQVPGYGYAPKYGRKDWTAPTEAVIALGQAYGVNLSKDAVLTPTQAVKAGIPAEIVDTIAERPARGFDIVPDDGTLAKKVFLK